MSPEQQITLFDVQTSARVLLMDAAAHLARRVDYDSGDAYGIRIVLHLLLWGFPPTWLRT